MEKYVDLPTTLHIDFNSIDSIQVGDTSSKSNFEDRYSLKFSQVQE